jgi:hypothetical protein
MAAECGHASDNAFVLALPNAKILSQHLDQFCFKTYPHLENVWQGLMFLVSSGSALVF